MFNIDNDDFDLVHFVEMCIEDDIHTPSRQSHVISETYTEDGFSVLNRIDSVDLWSCERYK